MAATTPMRSGTSSGWMTAAERSSLTLPGEYAKETQR